MIKFALILFVVAHSQTAPPQTPRILPEVFHNLQESPTVDIILTLEASVQSVLNKHQQKSFPNRGARITALASSLQAFTSKSQKSVIAFLKSRNFAFKSFWSTNKIFVKAATLELINRLSTFSEIRSINENQKHFEPLPSQSSSTAPTSKAIQWGVEMVDAPAAWAKGYKGKDVVIGMLDSGVRVSHNLVSGNFRKVRGWVDTMEGLETPYDNLGHGTHVMGTIVGADGYGVAPEATWMACATEFFEYQLLICGEYFICPFHPNGTEPDCTAAPHVVSNSWSGGSNGFFDDTLQAWNVAGIISVWSQGNTGPSCGTVTYPKYTNLDLIAAGATDLNDELADFSSRGPGRYNGIETIRPDISAPGVDIVSASHLSDTGVSTKSGTSMAAPHVTGVVALLLSNGTELTFSEVTTLIFNGAARTIPPTGANCGGIPETEYPNNAVGYGRISAIGAIEQLLKMRA